ncbi:MAG: CoA-binding protein [Polyangiaceae bacterium]
MAHPLETIIRNARGFVIIGDSSEGRFPAQSYNNYTKTGLTFYALDLGGLTESRGGTKGGKVYTKVEDLPQDHGDLAIIWVKPRSARGAVEIAHEANCKRVWFNFGSGHRDAVARAKELGMEVVEIGRCPVHYLEAQIPACRAHTVLLKLSGGYSKPPQLDADAKRRELI